MLNGNISSVSGVVNTSGANLTIDSDAIFDAASGKNIAIGAGTMAGVTSDADDNIALGRNALGALTQGDQNIAIGTDALSILLSGVSNVAVGVNALAAANGAESYNVAIGTYALGSLDRDSAIMNTAVGYYALRGGTSPQNKNVAVGFQAAYQTNNDVDDAVIIGADACAAILTSGADGTVAIGREALKALTSGAENVAVGHQALMTEDAGDGNTAIGYRALKTQNGDNNATYNTVIGSQAGMAITNSVQNVIIGYKAMTEHTTGHSNTAIGYNAMSKTNDSVATLTSSHNVFIGNLSGGGIWGDGAGGGTGSDFNVALGNGTLSGLMNGSDYNTAIGHDALKIVTSGGNNTAIGWQAGDAITTGTFNVAVGGNAGGAVTSGAKNVYVGYNAGIGVNGAGAYNTFIGDNANGINSHYQVAIGAGAVTQNKHETRIGAYGGLQFMSGEFEATVTSNDDNDVANTVYMFKIPARAFIKSISATILVLHGDTTADFSIVRSTDDAAADDEVLSDTPIQLLGADAAGTLNTGGLNSGGVYDIQCGSGTANITQVWYNETVGTLNTSGSPTEGADSYIWLVNSGTGNEDDNHATHAKLRVCVEFIGQC